MGVGTVSCELMAPAHGCQDNRLRYLCRVGGDKCVLALSSAAASKPVLEGRPWNLVFFVTLVRISGFVQKVRLLNKFASEV